MPHAPSASYHPSSPIFKWLARLGLITIGCAQASLAFAQPSLSVARPLEAREPQAEAFTILDRPTRASGVGMDSSVIFSPSDPGDVVLRFDPHLEHMFNEQVGLMATLPISQWLTSDSDNKTSLGNVDLGAFVVLPSGGDVDLILRGSLSLPSSSNDFTGFVTNVASSYARLGDLALAIPNLFIARASASVLAESGIIRFRADLGMDAPVAAMEGEVEDRTPLLHISGGVAVGDGPTKLVAELVNMLPASADNEVILHQMAVGVVHARESGTFKAVASVVADKLIGERSDSVLAVTLSYLKSY